jgi:hypothetical protein
MSKGLGLLVATILCFTFPGERPAMADSVQVTAWTYGWGCTGGTQTVAGSTIATASSLCVDNFDGGAESTSNALATRDPTTPLNNTITVRADSWSINGDNADAEAISSWNEQVNVYGGSGQGWLWLDFSYNGSLGWAGYGIAEAQFSGPGEGACDSPPGQCLYIVPFTFGQRLDLAFTEDAFVSSGYGSAWANLDISAPTYWFTDTNGNPIRGSFSPEPGTLVLLGSGLLGFAGFSKSRLFRRRD